MDEWNIEDLHCMVWHNNNSANEICYSKWTQSSFQWLEKKNIGLA